MWSHLVESIYGVRLNGDCILTREFFICADKVITRTICCLIVKKKMMMTKPSTNLLTFKPGDLAFSAVYETF